MKVTTFELFREVIIFIFTLFIQISSPFEDTVCSCSAVIQNSTRVGDYGIQFFFRFLRIFALLFNILPNLTCPFKTLFYPSSFLGFSSSVISTSWNKSWVFICEHQFWNFKYEVLSLGISELLKTWNLLKIEFSGKLQKIAFWKNKIFLMEVEIGGAGTSSGCQNGKNEK